MNKIYLLLIVLISFSATCQKIKLKGDYVMVDDTKCMKFTSKNLSSSNTFYNLEDKKMFYLDALTDDSSDAHFKLQFVGSEDVIRLNSTSMNFRAGIIKDLITEEVLNPKNCEVNFEKISEFKSRYHIEPKPVNTTVIVNQNQTAPATPRRGINVGVGFGR
ncbi:hypothetical protein ASG01_01325 [Chryseobacterium sp. Leaf180]|uniref:hypothetical protein n=1 Tax=Chryseobacterium sp. Leaf180 TaxID=1736289 RepID=UPI0006F40204|nr:hypothetical protein [Chryseobacterium sp. Leaf180]KQR94554.1 hypothetical protein ASG01_01325 [Chryseobacterium sp. Leaf180]